MATPSKSTAELTTQATHKHVVQAATKDPLTLTHFILEEGHAHPEATGDFTILLHSIEIAVKFISSKVRAAGLLNLYGEAGATNIQGETQKKLDVLANDAMISSLKRSHKVCGMVSEENEHPIVVESSRANYVLVFDPLDGSSNIDVNISIGTIFGVYRKRSPPGTAVTREDILQPGRNLVAAGYVMFGSATLLVYTTGNGVNEFTLDPASGEFVLTHANIRLKARHPIYSINEGNMSLWDEPTRQYIQSLKFPPKGQKPYSLRYVGSMVADVHRTLKYGGVFAYPADSSSKSGKLRLLYEANPMSMIIEQAGGKATTGTQRILDIQPSDLHQRVPVFLGSRDDVSAVEAMFKQHQQKQSQQQQQQQPQQQQHSAPKIPTAKL